MKRYRFLLSGQWVAGFVLAVIFSLLCLYLGNWQMGRKEDLDYRNSLITENYHAAPLSFAEHTSIFSDFQMDNQWKPVSLTGRYLPDHQLLVRNRPYEGLNGFEILVPFLTDQGETVVINRGWVAAESLDASQPAHDVPSPPSGKVDLVARVHSGEADTGKSAPTGQISSIDLAGVAQLTGLDTAEGAYGRLASEIPAAANTPQLAQEPELDTGPNLSYSVQWYVFALMCYVAYIWLARQKVRNDELDSQVAAALEEYYGQFYDESGNYRGTGDESVLLRRMEMIDDMPAHMKAIVRPKITKKRAFASDEEIEDAILDARDGR